MDDAKTSSEMLMTGTMAVRRRNRQGGDWRRTPRAVESRRCVQSCRWPIPRRAKRWIAEVWQGPHVPRPAPDHSRRGNTSPSRAARRAGGGTSTPRQEPRRSERGASIPRQETRRCGRGTSIRRQEPRRSRRGTAIPRQEPRRFRRRTSTPRDRARRSRQGNSIPRQGI